MENEPTNNTDNQQNIPAPAATPEPTPAPDNQSSIANSQSSIDNIPEYTKEAADALNAAYALTPPDNSQSPIDNSQSSIANSQSTDYTLTFPEEFSARPDADAYNTILAPIAQKSGMDGEAFGKLFADSYAAIEAARERAEWQNRFLQDAELKKDWGADYEANMATARSHIDFLKEKAGLSEDDLAVFSSPKGMRALFAMASVHKAPPAAGLAASQTEKSWADAVMKPGHPDYEAFTNPLNPRYKEVNQRWLRAHGH